jgi:N-acyl-phosphatidylethanolamine-hydrolysing phospholipase D
VTPTGIRHGVGPRPDDGAPSFSSHHGPGGRFRNPWPGAELRGFGDLFRWGMQRRRQGVPPDPPAASFARVRPTFLVPGDTGLGVTWLGHAATLIQIAGRTLLTDPMLGARASPVAFAGPRRCVPPGATVEELPDVHVVLLSHNHYDHLDAGSVRALAHRFPTAEWYVPLGLGTTVRALGVERIRQCDWWDEHGSESLTVTATPAQHFSSRTPFDRNRSLWCGWAVTSARHRIFFAGDTGYHPEFAQIGRRLGPFDVQLLPIGAYEPRWFMRPVHMDPEEAVRAFLDAGGRERGALLPVHWGTFKLTDEPMDEPPRRVRVAWEQERLPAERLWLLRHGETKQAGSMADSR